MKEHSYMAFLQEAKQFIPQERIYTDELRRLAWVWVPVFTDSFPRL